MQSDIIIIGAGPVGLFTAFYAGLRNLSTQIIDSLPEVGGQPKALYPEKTILDIPAFPKISGKDLIEQLSTQLTLTHPDTRFHLGETATEIEESESGFRVHTNKNTYEAKAILLACGNGSFSPRRADIQNLADYEYRQIHYHVSNYSAYLGKKVAICGGGDSAFDHALALSAYAEEVYIVHRRPRFRAQEHSVALAEAKENIHFLTPYTPQALLGENQSLRTLRLNKARSEETKDLNCDAVIMAYGFTTNLGPIKDWGFEIERNRIKVDEKLRTNRPGIFALGDLVSYPGKVQLIVSGFGEAPTAVNAAFQYIYPEKHLSPLHSTDLDI